MYQILEAKCIAHNTYEMKIKAPLVAKSCLPGHFVICKIDEVGERIPLTITDYDREEGSVNIIFQAVGASTYRMSKLKTGDYFQNFVGPLGQPSEFVHLSVDELKKIKFLFVGGGVGIAPVYPQVKWLKEKGIDCDAIIGAKTKDLLILEEEMRAACKNLYICTDDGSYGMKGLVTQMIDELIQNQQKSYDHCVAIGPVIMMKFTCLTTKKYNLPTTVSMNPIMVDGTGMCGACRVLVGDEVKFACVDGPEFDGFKVDFDQAMIRQNQYKTEEGREMLRIQEGHTHHGGCGQC